jgi:hypothetical protein
MDSTQEEWMARIAVALCVASRWLSAVALALSGIALVALYFAPAGSAPAATLLSLAAAAGAIQAYLVLRIEFDKQVFEAIVTRTGATAAALQAFDGALQALALSSDGNAGRPLRERVQGMMSLIMKTAWVLAIQFALLILVPWLPQ